MDPIVEIFLIETTIDYISQDYDKNIFENKFIFIPDKDFATSCGCGISFFPKINHALPDNIGFYIIYLNIIISYFFSSIFTYP